MARRPYPVATDDLVGLPPRAATALAWRCVLRAIPDYDWDEWDLVIDAFAPVASWIALDDAPPLGVVREAALEARTLAVELEDLATRPVLFDVVDTTASADRSIASAMIRTADIVGTLVRSPDPIWTDEALAKRLLCVINVSSSSTGSRGTGVTMDLAAMGLAERLVYEAASRDLHAIRQRLGDPVRDRPIPFLDLGPLWSGRPPWEWCECDVRPGLRQG